MTLKLFILYYCYYDDKGSPINNRLSDLRSLIELLAVRTKLNGEKKERPGFTATLNMMKKMKTGKRGKEIPDCSQLDLEFMFNRKFGDIKEDRFPKLPGK